MHFSNPQEAIAELSEIAVSLVLHNNTRPSQITEAISRRLHEEAENFPKLEVLYNKRHGGFGYSEEFEAYLPVTAESSSHKLLKMPAHLRPYMTAGPEGRINACGYIRPFGKEQASKFPLAYQVVLSYYANRIDSLESDMGRLAYSENAGGNSEAVQQATTACGDLPEGLLESYCSIIKQGRKRRDWQIDQTFQQTLSEIGEDDEQIWFAQHVLSQDVMVCLHRWLRRGGTQQQQNLDIAYKMFGLMCASGDYCQLAVQEVPQIVEWHISEYDGKELVVTE